MLRRAGESGLGELAAVEAAAAGFAGAITYDERAGVLHFEGLGDVDVAAAFRRATELEGDARRQYVRGTVRNFLRSSTPLPAAYADADAELAKRIRTHLELEAKHPTSPVPQEQLGRVERHLGTGDWAGRLRSAADGYAAWYRERGDATLLLDAANLYRLVGDTALGRSIAEEAAAALAPIADDWTEASLNPFAGYRCAALALADDLQGLAGELERRGAAQLGPRWTPIAVAAAAAVRGDRDSLEREVTAWRRLAAAEPVDTNGSSPSDRDLEEMLDEWLRRTSR